MRFIGNKEKLLERIYQAVLATGVTKGHFCDFFSGTSNVGRFFKEKGFKITSSDLLYFSYVLQKAYISNNNQPTFKKLLQNIKTADNSLFSSPLESVRNYLNNLRGINGFIYKNYTEEGTKNQQHKRKYFTAENGKVGKLGNDVGEGSNVVVVGVGEDHADDVFGPVVQVANVGNQDVDAGHI